MNSEKKLKLLPLGEQNFKKIIDKNLLYVDNTEDIQKLYYSFFIKLIREVYFSVNFRSFELFNLKMFM